MEDRIEFSSRYLPQSLSVLFGDHWIWACNSTYPDWLVSPWHQVPTTVPIFYLGDGDLNSCSHICTAGTESFTQFVSVPKYRVLNPLRLWAWPSSSDPPASTTQVVLELCAYNLHHIWFYFILRIHAFMYYGHWATSPAFFFFFNFWEFLVMQP